MRYDQLTYVECTLDYIEMEHKVFRLYHPYYKIRLYFEDTIHLNPGRSNQFPMAVYDVNSHETNEINFMKSNPSYENQQIEISSAGKTSGDVFYKVAEVSGTNMQNGKPIIITDTIWIKVF